MALSPPLDANVNEVRETLRPLRNDFTVALHAAENPFAVGAVIRVAHSFLAREIVLIGRPAEVDGALAGLTAQLCQLAATLDLRCTLEPAGDPFFRGPDSAEALSQRAGYAKLELRVDLADAPPLAVASINRHGDHFGARFDITAAGEAAHSACVAFGLERWAYVLLAYHGLDTEQWPEVIRG